MISVRRHGQGDVGSMSIQEFSSQLVKEITI
jgi:threonyl-tRNA synthetase